MGEELVMRMKALAADYVPEWRFKGDDIRLGEPGNYCDMGSGLALFLLRMLEDSDQRLQLVPKLWKQEYFSILGIEKRPAVRAEGTISFSLVKEELPGTMLRAGAEVVADLDGKSLSFHTTEDVWVAGVSIRAQRFDGWGWYLCLGSNPGNCLLHMLVLLNVAESGMPYQLVLEMAGVKNGTWEPCELSDGTAGLSMGGILRFMAAMGEEPTEQWGEKGWWLRLRSEDGRPLPKEGARFYMNTVSAMAAEGGIHGNIPAGTPLRLVSSSGYISKAENPDMFWGGCDEETEAEAVDRGKAGVRHGGRAVTPGDFERLCREAVGGKTVVRCFSGYDEDGNRKAGGVTIVVLPMDYPEGHNYFYKVRDRIFECLIGRTDENLIKRGDLHVILPLLVWIDVTVRVSADNLSMVMEVKAEVKAVLERYLIPSPESMGHIPGTEQMKHILYDVKHLVCVKKIAAAFRTEDGRRLSEEEMRLVQRVPWILPCGGSHDITVSGPEGG